MKTTKLVLGLPWYTGADPDCFDHNFEFLKYLGRLTRDTEYRAAMGPDEFNRVYPQLKPLIEPDISDHGLESPTLEDWDRLGILEIGIANYSRFSLPGKARERVVESAQQWDADWLLFWDADMRWNYSAFLRLWRHQKPVVAALAFTARDPVEPVIYRIRSGFDPISNNKPMFTSEPVLNYPKDQLITDADIDGHLAFGFGVVLLDMRVFKQIPLPWFSATGCGEDWFFCTRCHEHNVQRFIDTSVKTCHKLHAPKWSTEEYYWQSRELHKSFYKDTYPDLVGPSPDGDNGQVPITPLQEVLS